MEVISRAILAAMVAGLVVTCIVPVAQHAYEKFPTIATALR